LKCAECGSNEELVEETRDMPYTYKGRKTVLKDIAGGWCPGCGEVYFRLAQGDKYMAAIRAFKQVNESEGTP
jgi:HTH-type transcriptional regulator/antitoxin MqsA